MRLAALPRASRAADFRWLNQAQPSGGEPGMGESIVKLPAGPGGGVSDILSCPNFGSVIAARLAGSPSKRPPSLTWGNDLDSAGSAGHPRPAGADHRQTDTRSQTKMRVSPGAIASPAPRSP